ncbi:MAG: hemolysin family protein [Anaerolineales bacterium]
MAQVLLELSVLVLLAIGNGVFAMSEIAVVSARPARLEQRAAEGSGAAGTALQLTQSPGPFLSTVQIGITLIGVLSGAFGGTTLGTKLAIFFQTIPVLEPYSRALGVTLIVLFTTYLSLIVGELAPKAIALSNPEKVAARIAPAMQWLATLASPIVAFLDASTKAMLRLLGQESQQRPPVTEDEIKLLLRSGAEAGTFDQEEQVLVERVFRLADRRLGSVLTPRPEVVWLDLEGDDEENHQRMITSIHSRFPVGRGSLDDVVGVVQAKDLLALCLAGEPVDPERVMREAKFVPESMPALEVLEAFKEAKLHMALVMDEYGGLEGIVTTNDILDALVGELPEAGEEVDFEATQREDGSWLIDGMLPIEEFQDLFDIRSMPGESRAIYETVGGFVMMQMERVPRAGDRFEWSGYSFEVMDMDGLRVDKILLVPPEEEGESR